MSGTPLSKRGLARRPAQRKFLTTGHREMQQSCGLQERFRATLTETTSSHAEADGMDALIPKPSGQPGRVISPRLRPGEREIPCEYQ